MRNNMQVMFPLQASAGAGALVYKDTVSSASDLPSSSEAKVGWLYIADTAFLLNGTQIEIGDELYWNGTTWNIVQGNITIPDVWRISPLWVAVDSTNLYIRGAVFKNNVQYTNGLYIACDFSDIDGSNRIRNQGNFNYSNYYHQWSTTLVKKCRYVTVSIYPDYNYTNPLYVETFAVLEPAKEIASDDFGFVNASQVYQALQNVQFDINSLTTETATPTLVGMEDIETALEGI